MSGLNIIIDTSVLIDIEKNNNAVVSKLEKLDLMENDIYITSPTYSEFYLGLLTLSNGRLKQEKERLDKYKLLNTTKNSSKILAEIKHHVSKGGIMVPLFDLLIASIAMDAAMPLITLDNHFKNVPNLNVIVI